MNQDLADVIKKYATVSHRELSEFLESKSKDNIMAILVDLLTQYFNDKNSSTLREYLVVVLSGYEPNYKKIGYDGYRQVGIDSDTPEYCEAKPKNINTYDEKPKKLNGAGNFTDYTWARFEKDKQVNPTMIIAGFIDGKLIHIFRFPFNSLSFTSRLEEQLKRHFPNGYESGRFLRSATFGLKHYKDISKLSVDVYVGHAELDRLKDYIAPQLLTLLKDHSAETK